MSVTTRTALVASAVALAVAAGAASTTASRVPGAHGYIVGSHTETGAEPYSGLVLYDIATGQPRRLTNGDDSEPAFSPDGRRIAFVRRVGLDQTDIWTIGVDGSELHQLTFDATADAPAWSSDASRIAFTSARDRIKLFCDTGRVGGGDTVPTSPGEPMIYTTDASGSSVTRAVAGTTSGQVAPHWLPDSRMTFWTETPVDTGDVCPFARYDLRVGGVATGASFGGGRGLALFDREPAVSPDGTRIAWSDQDAGAEMYVERVDGTDRRTIGHGRDPFWTTDGAAIVFVNDQSGDTCARSASGGKVIRLTDNARYQGEATFDDVAVQPGAAFSSGRGTCDGKPEWHVEWARLSQRTVRGAYGANSIALAYRMYGSGDIRLQLTHAEKGKRLSDRACYPLNGGTGEPSRGSCSWWGNPRGRETFLDLHPVEGEHALPLSALTRNRRLASGTYRVRIDSQSSPRYKPRDLFFKLTRH